MTIDVTNISISSTSVYNLAGMSNNGIILAGYIIGYTQGNSSIGLGALVDNNGTITYLPSNGVYNYGNAINNSGEVIGQQTSSTAASATPTAGYWLNGAFTAVTLLPTTVSANIRSVNNQGVMVGSSQLANGSIVGVLWQNGVPTSLGVIGDSSSSSVTALSINDVNQVVGLSATGGFEWQNGVMAALPTLPGWGSSTPYKINNAGQIVGAAFNPATSSNFAVTWQNGLISQLPTLTGETFSLGVGINSQGEMVGYGSIAGNQHALLWRNGQVIDLNSLLVTNSGWVLNAASAISDSDRIIGSGTLNGVGANFVLDLNAVAPPLGTAAYAVYAFQGGLLNGPIAIRDSSLNLIAQLDSLAALQAAGDLSSIVLTDNNSPITLNLTASQLTLDAKVLAAISTFTLVNAPGLSAGVTTFTLQQNQSTRGANGVNLDAPGAQSVQPYNSVIGFQSAATGFGNNAVVLDGPQANYALQVAANGTNTIKDIGPGDATFGQIATISGYSYIVFNGATLASHTVAQSGAPTYPGDMYYVLSPANASLAQFYAAILQRVPDLAGLEYWQNALSSGQSMNSVAQAFIGTSAFASLIGADPSTLTPTQYVTDLYQSILGRNPDPSGLQYWVGQMNQGASQASVLVSFTNATATLASVNAFSGGSGWLINPSVTGGYADPGLQMSAQTVLAQAQSSGFYNLSLVDPTSSASVGGVTVANGAIALAAAAKTSTVFLSGSFQQITAANSGDIIHDGAGSDVITLSGSGHTVILGSASSDQLSLSGATGSTVFGVSSTTKLLASGDASPTYKTIGSVGGGSLAEATAAAAAAYLPSGAAGEHVMFLGTDSGGDAQIWSFHGQIGSHQLVASEMTLVATLIGVPASSLTASMLG